MCRVCIDLERSRGSAMFSRTRSSALRRSRARTKTRWSANDRSWQSTIRGPPCYTYDVSGSRRLPQPLLISRIAKILGQDEKRVRAAVIARLTSNSSPSYTPPKWTELFLAATRILNDADGSSEEEIESALIQALDEFPPCKTRTRLGIHDLFLDSESRYFITALCRYPGLRDHPQFPSAASLATAFLGPCGDVRPFLRTELVAALTISY